MRQEQRAEPHFSISKVPSLCRYTHAMCVQEIEMRSGTAMPPLQQNERKHEKKPNKRTNETNTRTDETKQSARLPAGIIQVIVIKQSSHSPHTRGPANAHLLKIIRSTSGGDDGIGSNAPARTVRERERARARERQRRQRSSDMHTHNTSRRWCHPSG